MAPTSLGDALIVAVQSVKWDHNVSNFAAAGVSKERVATAAHMLALWSKQLETADHGNRALTFVREMQLQAQYGAALITLGLYKPAAANMRAVLESAMYYTYFRTHPTELETLIRSPKYFLDKSTVVKFHNAHTVSFGDKEKSIKLSERLEQWYSSTSAIIHGQIPGKWVKAASLKDVAFDKAICEDAVTAFEAAAELVHGLFLCTVDLVVWYQFSKPSKNELLKSLSTAQRKTFGLPSS